MRTSSERVFVLKQHWLSIPSVLRDTQLWREVREILNVAQVKWVEVKRKSFYRRQGYVKCCRPLNNLYTVDRFTNINYLILNRKCFGLLGH
jgi:hypothetical protein